MTHFKLQSALSDRKHYTNFLYYYYYYYYYYLTGVYVRQLVCEPLTTVCSLTIFGSCNIVFPEANLLYLVFVGRVQRAVRLAQVVGAVSQQVGVGSTDVDSLHRRSHQQVTVVVSLRVASL